VPVLVISGRSDLRTPLESARRTASQYPDAKLLAVPGVGHSVLSSDPTGCALAGMVAFLGGAEIEQCSRRDVETPVLQEQTAPYAPATIGGLRPTRLPGLAGRTLSAVSVTLTGIGFDLTYAPGASRSKVILPGLRAGFVRATKQSLELEAVEWVRGVRVTGRLDARGRGTLTVSGPAAAGGTVTYTRERATGTLGGRAFRLER
jgi:hypothetical protein